jgi:hypothetical protein
VEFVDGVFELGGCGSLLVLLYFRCCNGLHGHLRHLVDDYSFVVVSSALNILSHLFVELLLISSDNMIGFMFVVMCVG